MTKKSFQFYLTVQKFPNSVFDSEIIRDKNNCGKWKWLPFIFMLVLNRSRALKLSSFEKWLWPGASQVVYECLISISGQSFGLNLGRFTLIDTLRLNQIPAVEQTLPALLSHSERKWFIYVEAEHIKETSRLRYCFILEHSVGGIRRDSVLSLKHFDAKCGINQCMFLFWW